jgi:ABC-2 type transport system ATP-binding protein
VDSDFLRKALSRLHQMMQRSGILVFASHSNEFLARLRTTAIRLKHGEIKMIDDMENVVRADDKWLRLTSATTRAML